MSRLLKVPALLAIISALGACRPANTESNSRLDGHYEEADAKLMSNFLNGQTAVEEYAESRGVIIAINLLRDYGKAQMAADILATSIETLWITVPSNYRGTLSSPEFDQLRQLSGKNFDKVQLVKQKVSGRLTVWSRDWAPLGARTGEGKLHLLDFNYYTDRSADDSTARSLLPILPVPRVSIPVYNEGGNFMNNSQGTCMMSTRVTDANAFKELAEDIVLDAEGVTQYYQDFAGCKNVYIFPRMPYEGTGHIDMWAKFLDDETLIVGELRDEILGLESYSSSDLRKVQSLKNYLDERAKEIQALGFKVIRLPMPAPLLADQDVFRSYTNSLTLNGKVLVPRYLKPAYASMTADGQYPDAQYISAYEAEVRDTYERLGYTFIWVDSDNLIADGGAVHCTTMQIAK